MVFDGRRLKIDGQGQVVLGGPWQAAGTFDNGFAFWCTRRRRPYCCLSFSPYMGERNNIGGRFGQRAFVSRLAPVRLAYRAWRINADRSPPSRAYCLM